MAYNLNDPNRVTYFAETDSRNRKVKFGIKAKDRPRHMYVIGKTGMGKSTLLENMAVQDIQNGEGVCFIDPHGKTAELLLDYVPAHRVKDVIYFAPFDIDNPIAFNVMEDVGVDKRHLVVNGLMSAFSKLFGEESFSDRMQYILQNTILALLEFPGSTMLGINRMLTDKAYRNEVVANVTDMSVKTYWTQEFAKYTEKFAAEATPAIQNKMGQFTSNPLIRNLIGQPKSTFDIRKVMDERKILIVNLSKGRVGEGNANLLGSMIITKLYLAALSRADLPESILNGMPNFYLYVDEFQSFANKSFADILSEARKYKLNLTIAHQYIEQMEEEVRDAVFGNVGTMCTFRVGAFDAEVLEKEFGPQFMATDLVNLGFAQIYLKLMIDGVSSQPFSANTLGPIPKPLTSLREEVINMSRAQFSRPRTEVEKEIKDWYAQVFGAPKKDPAASGAGGASSSGAAASVPAHAPRPAGSFAAEQAAKALAAAQAARPASSAPAAPAAVAASSAAGAAAGKPAAVSAAPSPRPSVPPPAANTPFKKAFSIAAADLAPVLAAVAPSASAAKSASKPPSPEKKPLNNISGLREALAALKRDAPVPPAPAAVLPPKPQLPPPPVHVSHAEKPKAPEASSPVSPLPPVPTQKPVREIPEDVLRKMLEVPPSAL